MKRTGIATGVSKKSSSREWFNSVMFAVVAATLIRWIFFEAFVIPTSSMENSLLVGDYLFVSKLHYGVRTPKTPLQVPLTHQTIWGTKIPSYLSWIQVPQFRLPGFSKVNRGDAVVFNLPVEHPEQAERYKAVLPDIHPHPVDLRVYYIKRCVAVAGDTLSVRDGQVYINNQPQSNPARIQNEYFVSVSTTINESKVFRENGISEFYAHTETYGDTIKSNDQPGYLVFTTNAGVEILKKYDFVKDVKRQTMEKGLPEAYLFPTTQFHNWNRDNCGPLVVPRKGMTVRLTPENSALYGEVIKCYEGNNNIELNEYTVKQDGVVLENYTFKQDYYYMMGDNRHNSADSRYWGFVPHDHVLGKAVFVWLSLNPHPTTWLNKIRWDRMFRLIDSF
jgi:signal peptidase I